MIAVPVEWILSVLIAFGGVIGTLATVIYRSLMSRLSAQDKIIEDLRRDIERMATGCGIHECLWRSR